MRIILTLVLILLVCPGLKAQQHHTLRGTVVDAKSKAALPNATIKIEGTGKIAITDKDGVFQFADLGSGSDIDGYC